MQEFALSIGVKIAAKMAGILPRIIKRRLFKVADNIRIEFRSSKDTILSCLSGQPPSQVPFLCLDFEITNFNPFELALDRFLLEVWFGQPTLYDGAILERHVIPSGAPGGYKIHLQYAATDAQKQQIEDFLNNQFRGQLHIHYTAYFESTVGLTEVSGTIAPSQL